MSLALGVDVGGSTVRVAVVQRLTGQVVSARKAQVAQRSPEAVVGRTLELVRELGDAHGVERGPIGVGFAAMLRGSVVVNAPNLGWRNVDFGALLETALGREVRLFNDLSAAAWGEFRAGAAKGTADSLTVFVGTGVGSAIISGGVLVLGASQVAGEFGHVKIIPDGGRRCGCGQHGCLEAYAGGAKLAEWMSEEGVPGLATDLEAHARSGNPVAQRMYDFVVRALSVAVANQVTMLNPSVLVLGGGVLARCPGMVDGIRRGVERWATGASGSTVRIELATLGDDAGLVGAALLA
jgi:glucokinase